MSVHTRGEHTCWRLSTEAHCFECLRPMVALPSDSLEDMAPSFDQDAYYDGEPGT